MRVFGVEHVFFFTFFRKCGDGNNYLKFGVALYFYIHPSFDPKETYKYIHAHFHPILATSSIF